MLTFKNLILIIFIIGIIIVTREATKMSFKCPKKEVEFKYMPRTLDVDLKDSANVDKIFKRMFQIAEPWVSTSRADAKNFRTITNNDDKNEDDNNDDNMSDKYKEILLAKSMPST
jgi:hypothetical protein